MSLLGHLVPRISASGAEPAATQALAYLLNASAGPPRHSSASWAQPASRRSRRGA